MENLMTDSIKLLEDGLAPLLERIKNFEYTAKNRHSERELKLIIQRIEKLPKYTEEELNAFVEELYRLSQYTENELLAFIEDSKEAPKKNECQIRHDIKTLKYQPQRAKKEIAVLDKHLRCFPEYKEEELAALLEYIKLFPKKMEEEINAVIEDIKRLSTHRDEDTDALLKYIEAKELPEQTKEGLLNFMRRIALIKHLYFVESIKHLERDSQEELTVLTRIIRKHIPKCTMIILFGSYARGTEVVYDERVEKDGSNTSYQSDFDIMILLQRPASEEEALRVERTICRKIKAEYNEMFLDRRHAPPQFIVESEKLLRENLDKHQPFFSDIIKEGIFLYNDNKFPLPEPQELLYKMKKELAQEYFEHFSYSEEFLFHGKNSYERGNYVSASFQLHQACENYYRDMSMVFINYHPKLHNLEELIEKTRNFSTELSTVFPRVTDFEIKTFNLLRDAYIDARYNLYFSVTKEELEYMLERTEALREITYRICKEQIEYYDIMAREE